MGGLTNEQSNVVSELLKRVHWLRNARRSLDDNQRWVVEYTAKAREAGVSEPVLQALLGDDLPPVPGVAEGGDAT